MRNELMSLPALSFISVSWIMTIFLKASLSINKFKKLNEFLELKMVTSMKDKKKKFAYLLDWTKWSFIEQERKSRRLILHTHKRLLLQHAPKESQELNPHSRLCWKLQWLTMTLRANLRLKFAQNQLQEGE